MPNDGIYLSNDTYQKFLGDTFEQDSRSTIADEWQRQATAAIPSMVADAQDRQQQAQRNSMADQFLASVPDIAAQHVATLKGPESLPNGLSVVPTAEPSQSATVAPDTAPAMGQAGVVDTSAPSPQTPAVPTVSPPATGYEAAARAAAQKYGIDPDLFARQISQESGFNPNAQSPAGARGIAQFMPDTARGLGVNPDDPEQALDGAARYMAQLIQHNGGDVSKALAAYNAGQGNVDKYGGIPPFEETKRYVDNIMGGAGQVAASVGSAIANSGAGRVVTAAVNNVIGALRPSQFGVGLSDAEAYAACGPVAAMAFARATGQNPTAEQAVALAKQLGWTPAHGMAGPGSELDLLKNMGVPAHMEQAADPAKIAQDVQNGNPVIISTPGHYFVADGYDPQKGFHVGSSGTDLKAGSEWMSLDQMQRVMGAAQATLYLDRKPGDGPSVAAQMSQSDQTTDQVAANTSTPAQPQSMWDKLGSGISDVFKNIFGGAAQMQAGQEAQARGTTQATEGLGGAVTSALAGAGGQMQTSLDLQRRGQTQIAEGFGNALTEPQPWMQNVVGAQTKQIQADTGISPYEPGQQQLSPPEQYAQARGIATGLAQTVVPEDLLARAATTGSGSLARSGEVAQDVLTSRQPAQIQVGLAAGVPAVPAASGPAQSANPLIQRTGQMLEAKPPEPAKQGLVERIVQAATNRYVAADRYQEDALRAAGLDVSQPAQDLDLSAAIRLASDPAAEIRLQQGLRPALQSVGDDRSWLSAYLMHANNVDVAAALGNADRTFPGGFKAADSAQVLADLPTELGPQRFGQVQQAADQVYDFTHQLRRRMVDSGLIDAQTAQQWEQRYPHWVPTRVLDYMDEAGGPKVGTKISLSDNGVKQYTEEGTAKFAEDPLASLIGLTRQVESKAMKNDAANALVDLDNLRPSGQRLLEPTDRPVTVGESVIQRINNGTVERYVAPPSLAAVINGPQITQAPSWVRAWTSFIRSMTTVLSPTFALVRNPSLDIPEYMTRELARSGGNPLVIPHLVAELARGYADAFKGFSPLTEGTYAGAGTRQFMLGGGGSAAEVPRTFVQRGDAVARLAQDGVDLTSAGDVGRALKDLVTLKPVARTAERTELGPRVASMRLAEERGATPVRAILNGRSVTLDFNEGGTVAKTINQFVPFFNAGVQGSAQVLRMYRENPVGAVSAAMTMAGLPAIAAEAWNNSDPQRAKDYQDVPDYLKSQGVVIMMPGDTPTDDKGNRRPQFWWVNMRGLAPFASLAREAAAQVLQMAGNKSVQPQDWTQLGGDLIGGAFPIRANTIGDVPGALTGQGLIPGADVGLQLALNKDIFRKSDIVTPNKDQYASAVGWTVANALTNLARLQDPSWQVHPAQVDFAVQQLLGGVGSSVLGLGNMIAGQRRDNAPQSAPVTGGMVKALGFRGDTGQTLQDARSQILTSDAQRVLNDAGLQPPKPEPGTVHFEGFAIPLLQAEQARYQQLYNQRMSAGLVRYAKQLTSVADMTVRQDLMNQISNQARNQAEMEILQSVPKADLNQRIRTEDARRRVGGRP